MKVFTEIDHRLAVVKRWGILHTIQTQSVAEHCFNVERMAVRIAKHWFDITDDKILFRISQLALHHDNFEALSGDLPTMVKPYFCEEDFENDHKDLVPWSDDPDQFVTDIVKLADKLEGFHFICIERALGNDYVIEHYKNYWAEIETFLNRVWPGYTVLQTQVRDTMGYLSASRSTRFSRRGR
jgi:5'-deoxynucleotidase YfbR-like HD superfamily hydrolase